MSTVNSTTQINNPIFGASTLSLPATNFNLAGWLAVVLPIIADNGSITILQPGTLIDSLNYVGGVLQLVASGTTWNVLAGILRATGTGSIYTYNYFSATGPVNFNRLLGAAPVVRNITARLRSAQPARHRSRFPLRTDIAPATQATSTRSRSQSRHTTNTSDAVRDETPVIPSYDVAGNNTRSDDAELRVRLLDQPRDVSPALVLVPHNRLPEKEL